MYTAVSHYMDWVNSTILRSGGMEACGYILQATLQQGTQGTQETTAASAIEIQETTAAPAGIIVKKTLPQIYVLVSNEAS